MLADCIEPDCKIPNLLDILEPRGALRLTLPMRVKLRLEYQSLDSEIAAAYRDLRDLDVPPHQSQAAYEARLSEYQAIARRALSGEVAALEYLPQVARRFTLAVVQFYGSTQCSFCNLDQVREVLGRATDLIPPPSAKVKRRSDRAAAPPPSSADEVRASIRKLAIEDGKRLTQQHGPERLKVLHPGWSRPAFRELIAEENNHRTAGRPPSGGN